MNCLSLMASTSPISVLADNEAVACAVRVIEEQGTGAQPSHFALLFPTLFSFRTIVLLHRHFPPSFDLKHPLLSRCGSMGHQ
jgi:hypothetical protein